MRRLPNATSDNAREEAVAEGAGEATAGIVLAPAIVSIGIATARSPASIEALLLAMNDALYRAKCEGRDRIEIEKV